MPTLALTLYFCITNFGAPVNKCSLMVFRTSSQFADPVKYYRRDVVQFCELL